MAEEETNSFMQQFFADNPISEQTLKHFSSIEWTNKYLQDKAYEPIPTYSRALKPTGEDYFFSRTVSTADTIPYYLTLQLRDFQTPPVTKPLAPSQSSIPDHKVVTVVPEKPDCIFLLSFGNRGIDGHPRVVHGGMVCAILDETMGLMVMLHHNKVAGDGPRDLLFTINLNVSYRAQVPTPGEVVVKAWLVKREGRKWFTKGQILDKNGKLLSEGTGLWIVTMSKL